MSYAALAILSTFAFAIAAVMQQKGALQTTAAEGDRSFLREVIHKPVWLIGAAMQLLGCILQAAALHLGSLTVVQALCSLDMVIALPLGVRFTGQRVGRRSIIAACMTVFGILIFVAIGQPQGGISEPEARAWLAATLVISALAGLFAQLVKRRRGAVAAALFSTAAGVIFAYQAAVTKVFTNYVGDGLVAILTTWTTYALLISALIAFAFKQSALKTGFLAPAMAACDASILLMSMILGVKVFQETISNGQERQLPALIGLALAVIGVIMLAYPESSQLEPAPDKANT